MGPRARLWFQNWAVNTKPKKKQKQKNTPKNPSRRCTDTVPLPILRAVVDRGGILRLIHPTLPTGLVAAGWESAFNLGQPGLQTEIRKDWSELSWGPDQAGFRPQIWAAGWSLKPAGEGPCGGGEEPPACLPWLYKHTWRQSWRRASRLTFSHCSYGDRRTPACLKLSGFIAQHVGP